MEDTVAIWGKKTGRGSNTELGKRGFQKTGVEIPEIPKASTNVRSQGLEIKPAETNEEIMAKSGDKLLIQYAKIQKTRSSIPSTPQPTPNEMEMYRLLANWGKDGDEEAYVGENSEVRFVATKLNLTNVPQYEDDDYQGRDVGMVRACFSGGIFLCYLDEFDAKFAEANKVIDDWGDKMPIKIEINTPVDSDLNFAE